MADRRSFCETRDCFKTWVQRGLGRFSLNLSDDPLQEIRSDVKAGSCREAMQDLNYFLLCSLLTTNRPQKNAERAVCFETESFRSESCGRIIGQQDGLWI